MLVFQFASCKCDKKYNCPSLSEDSKEWLPVYGTDSIRFIDSSGANFTFKMYSQYISPAYDANACKHGEIGCGCNYLCDSRATIYMSSDFTLNNKNYYFISLEESGQNLKSYYKTGASLTYSIFDYTRKIDLINPSNQLPGDSLSLALSLGGITYYNVYVHVNDTLLPGYQNHIIWKAYYTKKDGVIGFYNKATQSLFYRY